MQFFTIFVDCFKTSRSKDREKNVFFKSGIMDKIQYESSNSLSDVNKYSCAVFQDGELHITPLHGLIQMRSEYLYFDKQENREKEEEADRKETDDEPGLPDEQELTQITVSFARNETERIKKAREKSYGYITKKSSEEPWCDSMWWHSNSDKAEVGFSYLRNMKY